MFGSLQHVSSGDIFDEAKVVRVDKSGLLLELPSKPVSTPAYVSVCSIGCSYSSKYLEF